MPKNKNKGGLIEDRKIRNPMDQMRRQLKFKAKTKRKEERLAIREIKQERDEKLDSQSNAFVLSKNAQSYQAQDEDSGINQQEQSIKMFQAMQENQQKMLQGHEINFEEQVQGLGGGQKEQQPKEFVQPYKRRKMQGNEEVMNKPFIYKSAQQKTEEKEKQNEAVKEVKEATAKVNKAKLAREKAAKFDPMDPSHGAVDFRDPEPEQEPETPDQQSLPVVKMLLLEKQCETQQSEPEIQQQAPIPPTHSRRFLPAALRRTQQEQILKKEDPCPESETQDNGFQNSIPEEVKENVQEEMMIPQVTPPIVLEEPIAKPLVKKNVLSMLAAQYQDSDSSESDSDSQKSSQISQPCALKYEEPVLVQQTQPVQVVEIQKKLHVSQTKKWGKPKTLEEKQDDKAKQIDREVLDFLNEMA